MQASPEVSAKTATPTLRVLAGLAVVFGLALIAWWITKQVYALTLLQIPGRTLEYPLWAALVGLVGNATLRALRLHEYIRPGVRTELFLKVGLVLLGAGLSLSDLVSHGARAAVQGVIMITAVFFFCWWLAGRFKLEDKLRAVMATAIAVCGVSAAIAAAGSVLAKKEQVTYVTTLVIVVALPLMVLMPLLAAALGLPQTVAGAWFGGNIDTTAAVIGAGKLYGAEAEQTAAIVKTSQNALIGVVAFFLALYFTTMTREAQQRPSLRLIWDRFPKFLLGFIAASMLFTFGVINGGKGTSIEALKNWAFTLAFVAMGLDFSVSELRRLGWAPLIVFLTTTVFNMLLALGLAWLLFGS